MSDTTLYNTDAARAEIEALQSAVGKRRPGRPAKEETFTYSIRLPARFRHEIKAKFDREIRSHVFLMEHPHSTHGTEVGPA